MMMEAGSKAPDPAEHILAMAIWMRSSGVANRNSFSMATLSFFLDFDLEAAAEEALESVSGGDSDSFVFVFASSMLVVSDMSNIR